MERREKSFIFFAVRPNFQHLTKVMPARPNNNKLYVVVSVESRHPDTWMIREPIIDPPIVRGIYDSLDKANRVASQVTATIVRRLRQTTETDFDEPYGGITRGGFYKVRWQCEEEQAELNGGHFIAVEVQERVVNGDGHEDIELSDSEDDDQDDDEGDEEEDSGGQKEDGDEDDDDEVQFMGMGAPPANKRQRTD